MIVEENGGPLGVVIDGANVHDTKLLDETIEAIVVDRPEPTEENPQNLCLDKGYDNPTGRQAAAKHGYTPHIRKIGEEKADPQRQEQTQTAAVGRRTHARLALQVPRDSRPLRQERLQLPWPDSIRLLPAVVPPRPLSEQPIALLRYILSSAFETTLAARSLLRAADTTEKNRWRANACRRSRYFPGSLAPSAFNCRMRIERITALPCQA